MASVANGPHSDAAADEAAVAVKGDVTDKAVTNGVKRGRAGEEEAGEEEAAPQAGAVVGGVGKRISPRFILNDPSTEVFSVRFSPDDSLVAASLGNGHIKVYSTATGELTSLLTTPTPGETGTALPGGRLVRLNSGIAVPAGPGTPITNIRWRPDTSAAAVRNVLVSVDVEGRIIHWHATKGADKKLHELREEDNQLYCIDFSTDGLMFATGGRQRYITVYDETTKDVSVMLRGTESSMHPGHSNRVFSIRFHPTEPIVVSGGWDHTVQLWDMRTGHAEHSLYGPFVCGDAVDLSADGTTILTGSWRSEKQLQLWDLRTRKLLEDIEWHSPASLTDQCLIYAAEFSKDTGSSLIAAGGSGANEAKIFDRESGNACIGTITGLSKGCYSVDFSCGPSVKGAAGMVAVAGGDGSLRLINIHKT
ncbi:unnamed protein product [Vitrella brassicaformis CCMP3155]|uniref:Uncharacterized protein n=1 Tax=Vitrella brassicaformis (strain CCMP3155) TaxID=1169540 RepID=A0A0G4EFH7_VITBC|nr:unnamed protein product [Vitrella brassicaformis CCMP3155]|eukprot:CEL94177.1 unnamed protein product [Vitrella brassicaformis CCMP3155]